MNNNQKTNKNKFDLEARTTEFAKRVIRLCKFIPNNPINYRLSGQAVGSAGSVGANYREANDSLGKKDFLHRLRISRKEAKEIIHWLDLIEEANPEVSNRMESLKQEAIELKKILSAIIIKSEKKFNKESSQ